MFSRFSRSGIFSVLPAFLFLPLTAAFAGKKGEHTFAEFLTTYTLLSSLAGWDFALATYLTSTEIMDAEIAFGMGAC